MYICKNMEKILNDKEIGAIRMYRSDKARNLTIKIKHRREVEVVVPYAYSFEEAEKFVLKKRDWIKRKLSQPLVNHLLYIDETHDLKTLSFTVKVFPAKREKLYFLMKDGVLRIEYPEKTDIKNEQVQGLIKKNVEYFLRREAKRLLPLRLMQLATIHGFTCNGVKIQSSQTRWGSCSRKKEINLSFYLLTVPPHLIDYVLLHELCHTVEMNHGDKFWKLMDKVTENKTKLLRKELKKYSCTL